MSRTLVILVVLLALLAGCSRGPARVNEVVAVPVSTIALNPADASWNAIPEHLAKLLPQDLVEPRVLKPTTPEVHVRSISNGADIAFRLEWLDNAADDKPGPAKFIDACAIQIPRKVEANVPEPQMGQAGKAVEIVFWRADWQATINGRGDTIRDLYPNASIDHYPFEAKSLEPGSTPQKEMYKRYAPARALGNIRSGPRESPVEEMIAEGPGSLSPGPSYGAKGSGVRTKQGWAVVISRKLPADLRPRTRTQIAFAIWEGSQNESGARKMRTGWIPLLLEQAK